MRIARRILVALGCLMIAGGLPLFVEFMVVLLGGRMPDALRLVLNVAGIGLGVRVAILYVRLERARSSEEPGATATALGNWKVLAYPSFGLILATLALAVAIPPKPLPRPVPTADEQRRLQEIPLEAITADEARFDDLRREFWSILDRGQMTPDEIQALRVTVQSTFRRLTLYWEDVNRTFLERRVVETPERLRMEPDLVAKGLLTQEAVTRTRTDLECIAKGLPVQRNGTSVVVTEESIATGKLTALQYQTAVEHLFERPPGTGK